MVLMKRLSLMCFGTTKNSQQNMGCPVVTKKPPYYNISGTILPLD
jgi:hypothetical protein